MEHSAKFAVGVVIYSRFLVTLRGFALYGIMTFNSFKLTDADLVEAIRSESPDKRRAENTLYKQFAYLIREGAWKHKLTADETSIAYSDTVLTVIESIEKGRYEASAALKTYVYQIFNNKCVDLIRRNSTNKAAVHRGTSLDEYVYEIPDDTRGVIEKLMQSYDYSMLYQRIKQLGDKCREMIRLWSEGTSDQLIAGALGYQSADVVKTSRLRCLDRLRALYGQSKVK